MSSSKKGPLPNTKLQRQFYQYFGGEALRSDETVFDVVDWMENGISVSVGSADIENGKAFFASHGSSNLADAATINVHVLVGAQTPSVSFSVFGKFDFDLEILEDATVSGGSALTAYNRNRTSAETASLTLQSDVTVSADGTVLDTYYFHDGQSFELSESKKILLSGGEDYVFRITSRANNNRVQISLDWAEADAVADEGIFPLSFPVTLQ